MVEKNLAFAKIVPTPTSTSWSQTYNAGNLFAVLSLERDEEKEGEEEILGTIGKGVLNSLEQEFFTLESKDLASIKGAVEVTAKKIPEGIVASLVVLSVVRNIGYLFVIGDGRVTIKRGDSIGTLIDLDQEKSLKAVSGILKSNDLLILQTNQFSRIVSKEKLNNSLDSLPPDEIAETLAPLLHEEEEGGAAAIIVEFKEVEETTEEQAAIVQPEEEKEEEQREPEQTDVEELEIPAHHYSPKKKINFLLPLISLTKKMRFPKTGKGFSHSKKLILTVAVIILVVFVAGIFLSLKKQEDAKVQALFVQVYPEAEKKYSEGQSLLGLNENLARESFQDAEKILTEGIEKFSKGSDQEKQISELLAKVQKAIEENSGINKVEVSEVDLDSSSLLAFAADNNSSYFAQDDNNLYFLDSKGVNKVSKSTEKSENIIEKSWEDAGGLGIYISNVYVLDKEDGIVKFVAASKGFGESQYFTKDASPDLSNAKAIAIDGSIWILLSDTILKYTKGNADGFTISGLDKPFSNPSKIYTSSDTDYLYILDNGNSRIVVIHKDGSYQSQYQADIIKNAKEFEVLEDENKILILSDDKIYQLDLE